jgi:hypothetical protein
MQPQKNPFIDLSLWSLLLSNIVIIFFATTEHWDLLTIMWIYWYQSIIIGLFNFIRILQLNEFSTTGFEINNHPVLPTQSTKVYTAFFFLFHFGFFHLVYAIFLASGFLFSSYRGTLGSANSNHIFLTSLIFFANHFFSYFYNRVKDSKQQNIGSLMFYPYVRIIPMHLTIIFGSIFNVALVLFLILKTFSDVIMHMVEHNVLRKNEIT